jgi:glutamyl/glutaminyl-tRNA synthetase
MHIDREKGVESANRNKSTAINLDKWLQMTKGLAVDYCIRAKIDMTEQRKCLRDPVIYRFNNTSHQRTKDKYKVYPCYDFACSLVDSIEGVTHAMRTSEYKDHDSLYKWIQEKARVRVVKLEDFARLNFVNTVLSKRKLQHIIEMKAVEGWNDPRMPTIQGITRRGLQAQAIIEFMLEQGPSKNNTLMEWDKLWSINKKIVDEKAGRYTAVAKGNSSLLIKNAPGEKSLLVDLHPKYPLLGKKEVKCYKEVFIESEDAEGIKEGEKVTLMKWGNCIITGKEEIEGKVKLVGELIGDNNFKDTKKLTWVPLKNDLRVHCKLIEFGPLINKPKIEETDNIDELINYDNRKVTEAYGELEFKKLKEGNLIQIERRGYFYVDIAWSESTDCIVLHYIPEGKTKPMSILQPKINVKTIIKGT